METVVHQVRVVHRENHKSPQKRERKKRERGEYAYFFPFFLPMNPEKNPPFSA